jgi:pyruvate,water dikinase
MRITVASKLILRKGERIVKSSHDLAKALRNEPLPETEQALLTRLTELVRCVRSQKSLFFLQAASGGTLPLLVNMFESRLPGEGHAMVSALLAGGKPTITAKQAYDLADLAKIAREDPIAGKWLADPRRNNDWSDALPEDNAFRVAFSGFLDRYGHRGVYETYIRHPRWREVPDYLFDTVHGLMKLDLEALRKQQRLAADEAAKRARHHLPFWLRPLLKGLIKTSGEETRHREAARSALISLIEPQRRILLRFGQLWRQRGVIQDPNAVFELSLPELQSYVDGQLSNEGLAARLSDRQKQLCESHALSVADVQLRHADDRRVIPGEKPVAITGDDDFQGMAVGTGVASGVVRILRSPDEGVRLEAGEVLAAPSTDPSWTPLFLKAGAVIMETGGYLSHGATVAREFGIPAVVNIPGILDRLEEGEQVEVDGCQGRIRRLKRGEPGS